MELEGSKRAPFALPMEHTYSCPGLLSISYFPRGMMEALHILSVPNAGGYLAYRPESLWRGGGGATGEY